MNATSSRRWPCGLLGMLVLVMSVEQWVGRHESRYTSVDYVSWARTREWVARSADCQVVILGDSLAKLGLLPAVIERRLPGQTCNLAVPGGHMPGNYFILRRLLASGARPRAILVDGQLLATNPMVQVRAWPELLDLGECVELAWAARDSRAMAQLTLGCLVPTYRTRTEARIALVAASRGRAVWSGGKLPFYESNWRVNQGALLLPPRETARVVNQQSQVPTRETSPVSIPPQPGQVNSTDPPPTEGCHPTNALFVTRLLDLAQDHDIPVFWLLPPLPPECQPSLDYGAEGQRVAFIRSLVPRYTNLTVIEGRRAGYPSWAFADTAHLSRPGAVAFSDAAAEVVSDCLGGRNGTQRWIDLPRWRDGVADEIASIVPAEDLQQTVERFRRQAALAAKATHTKARDTERSAGRTLEDHGVGCKPTPTRRR